MIWLEILLRKIVSILISSVEEATRSNTLNKQGGKRNQKE